MRVLVQRVNGASVTVGSDIVGAIDGGLLALVGVTHGDTAADARKLAGKTARLRVFDDEDGLMNLPLDAVGGAILAVSQFTLYADARKGNRPSFTAAAPPQRGADLFAVYVDTLRAGDVPVETGEFGAHMLVALVNDGPVTILLES
jgi:D-aminoacyl-tRNA deacylase